MSTKPRKTVHFSEDVVESTGRGPLKEKIMFPRANLPSAPSAQASAADNNGRRGSIEDLKYCVRMDSVTNERAKYHDDPLMTSLVGDTGTPEKSLEGVLHSHEVVRIHEQYRSDCDYDANDDDDRVGAAEADEGSGRRSELESTSANVAHTTNKGDERSAETRSTSESTERDAEKLNELAEATSRDYATNPVLMCFTDSELEKRYVDFQFVQGIFVTGKLYASIASGIDVAMFILFHRGGPSWKQFITNYWIGLWISVVITATIFCLMFIQRLAPYREYLFLAALFVHWPPFSAMALHEKHPHLYIYCYTTACFAFCAFLVQPRFFTLFPFLFFAPIITYAATTFAEPDYFDNHSYYEIIYWVQALFCLVALRVLERRTRDAFIEGEQAAAQIALLNHRTQMTQKLIAHFFPRSATTLLLIGRGKEPFRKFPNSVLVLTDVEQFTAWASNIDATLVVSAVNRMFTAMDQISAIFGIEKIATVGDSFLGGIFPREGEDHETDVQLVGFRCAEAIRFSLALNRSSRMMPARVAVHIGNVIAGFVGIEPPKFDLFGRALDKLQKLEKHGKPRQVHVSHRALKLAAPFGTLGMRHLPRFDEYGEIAEVEERNATTTDLGVIFDDWTVAKDPVREVKRRIRSQRTARIEAIRSRLEEERRGAPKTNDVADGEEMDVQNQSDEQNELELLPHVSEREAKRIVEARALDVCRLLTAYRNRQKRIAQSGGHRRNGPATAAADTAVECDRDHTISLEEEEEEDEEEGGAVVELNRTKFRPRENPDDDHRERLLLASADRSSSNNNSKDRELGSKDRGSDDGLLAIHQSSDEEANPDAEAGENDDSDDFIEREGDEMHLYCFSFFTLRFDDPKTERRYLKYFTRSTFTMEIFLVLALQFTFLFAGHLLLGCTEGPRNRLLLSLVVVTLLLHVFYLQYGTVGHRKNIFVVVGTYNLMAFAASFLYETGCQAHPNQLYYDSTIIVFYWLMACTVPNFCLDVPFLVRCTVLLINSALLACCIALRRHTIQDEGLQWDWLPAILPCAFLFLSYFADFALRTGFQSRMRRRALKGNRTRHAAIAAAAMEMMLPGFVCDRLMKAGGPVSTVDADIQSVASAASNFSAVSVGSAASSAGRVNVGFSSRLLSRTDENFGSFVWPYDSAFVLFVTFAPPADSSFIIVDVIARLEMAAQMYGLQKVKSIGTTLLFVGGVDSIAKKTSADTDRAEAMAEAALEMRKLFPAELNESSTWQCRIGMHHGPCHGAVIGEKGLAFDIFGDTVNTASRAHSVAPNGQVQCTEAFRDALDLEDVNFVVAPIGAVRAKGKGDLELFKIVAQNGLEHLMMIRQQQEQRSPKLSPSHTPRVKEEEVEDTKPAVGLPNQPQEPE